MEKLDRSLELYQEGAVYMRTHWEVFFIVLAVTVLQRLTFCGDMVCISGTRTAWRFAVGGHYAAELCCRLH